MVVDFDVLEYCKKLKNSKAPPYQCPVAECGRTYRSLCGMQYHLMNFDHNNPTPVLTPNKNSKKKGRISQRPSTNTSELLTPVIREVLTYAEAQKIVEFEVEGRAVRVEMNEPIPVISKQEYERLYCTNDSRSTRNNNRTEVASKMEETKLELPEPSFTVLDTYNIPDAPQRPNAYIRFIERSPDELDGEVEYDLDEEDCAWLSIINEKRAESGLPPVPVDTFELLMDRLEKESYFQMANSKSTECGMADDDAVCCICLDGECQNTNVILFCDMCNLAVHQDCYGVPYIPEGQWLCRRCLQSPSRAVDCVLCPNNGGAFKQTDRGHWAHVVCALWIPEVRFANTVFLEPIDSIETIPPARWKLTCYICKQRGVGACIQCHKTNCYAAFHVTCAQHTGLFMKMDTVKENFNASGDHGPVMVQKTAYCDAHTPADAEHRPRVPQTTISPPSPDEKDETKQKMKKARRILAKKRSSVPVISIPTIPPDRIQEIGSLVTVAKKSQFIQRLIAYWTLKRQFRNGVPLLRRLQSTHLARREDGKLITELGEFYHQIKYLQCLRQDLEKARLLCELVRKREKKKNELTKAKEACVMVELCPIKYFLIRVWELISAKDTNAIFMEPVDLKEVPDYTDVVKHPMDLSTIKYKIDNFQYSSVDDLEMDFNLMISNCLAYNAKDTIFYRAGIRMRDQGGSIIKSARKDAEIAGLDDETGLLMEPGAIKSGKSSEEKLVKEIDSQLESLKSDDLALEERMIKLMDLADQAQILKQGPAKGKRCRLIKMEMAKLKRQVSMLNESKKKEAQKAEEKNESYGSSTESDSSGSENKPLVAPVKKKSRKKRMRRRSRRDSSAGEPEAKVAKTEESVENVSLLPDTKTLAYKSEPTTPVKQTIINGDTATVSPSGVNRRTAVLFTRKAQAAASAFKKPNTDSGLTSPGSPGKKRRGRQGRPKKNAGSETAHQLDKTVSSRENELSIPCSDSFRVYRSGGDIPQETDEDTQSESSCSSCSSGSEGSSSCSSSEVDLGGEGGSSSDDDDSTNEGDTPSEHALEPLDLVWAKCRGYPWYPALIINPKMPRNYVHNGVPIPAPPADVLALANSYQEHVYLVLFFDTKRTWQWLPRNKLELLGVSSEVDEGKLIESRKPTDRKAVRKAYQEALLHRCQVDQNKTPLQSVI
ncbi:hypothetical protein RUM43_002330 [Polyplax serrata]|uniref:Peregrin n=1 Tax=Polyplax serrata TaxID=468196 RepID=A0AAN8NUF5_POLSC